MSCEGTMIGSPFAGERMLFEASIRVLASICASSDSGTRSEEHTSELQSLTNLVCRLLLEKKKKNIEVAFDKESTDTKIRCLARPNERISDVNADGDEEEDNKYKYSVCRFIDVCNAALGTD